MSDDWYKRDIRAAIAGMTHLTLEERGAYNTIIDHQYLMGRGLADNDHYIAGLMGCDVRVWKRVKTQLLAKNRIVVSGGLIADMRASYAIAARQVKRTQPIANGDSTPKSPTTLNEINNIKTTSPADAFSRLDKRREENKKDPPYPPLGGDAREAILEADAGGRAKDKVAGNGAIVPAETITDAAMLVGADFEEFWSAYPEKTAKPKARAAYFRVRRGYRPKQGPPKSPVDHWVIMAGLRTYLGWVARAPADDKPPLLHPTTFLNGERWNDIRQERTGRQTIGNATVAAGRRLYERMTANNGADHDQQEPDDDRPERQAQLPSPRNYQ